MLFFIHNMVGCMIENRWNGKKTTFKSVTSDVGLSLVLVFILLALNKTH